MARKYRLVASVRETIWGTDPRVMWAVEEPYLPFWPYMWREVRGTVALEPTDALAKYKPLQEARKQADGWNSGGSFVRNGE